MSLSRQPVKVYGHTEVAKLLCLDLLWKPIKGKIRFVLAITSRGPIILMSSDLSLSAVQILELYCKRASKREHVPGLEASQKEDCVIASEPS